MRWREEKGGSEEKWNGKMEEDFRKALLTVFAGYMLVSSDFLAPDSNAPSYSGTSTHPIALQCRGHDITSVLSITHVRKTVDRFLSFSVLAAVFMSNATRRVRTTSSISIYSQSLARNG